MTVNRIWLAFGLQPHRSETFKLSKDPLLIDKVCDIVGLYMNPPEHAVVVHATCSHEGNARKRLHGVEGRVEGVARIATGEMI